MRSKEFWSDKLGRSDVQRIDLCFTVTAAGTIKDHMNSAALVSFGAITDAAVAAFLGVSASPFTAAAFDATAMGADVLGGVVNMEGQVQELFGMQAALHTADTAASVMKGCEDSAALTASTLVTECAKSANGDIGFKINFGNTPDFDGITAGFIVVTFFVKLK